MKSASLRLSRAVASVGLLVVVLLVPQLSACLMYMADEFIPAQDAENLAKATVVSAAQITLAWDPPTGPVEKYLLYFRIHGTPSWVQLGEIAATPSPEYTVQHTTLGNGEFDFGVRAEYSGSESNVHTSLDRSADPTTGWYLKWQR